VPGNFLEQVRKAQRAAKTKPETGALKPADEIIDANLGAEVKPTPSSKPAALVRVLRFFGFPDFVTGL
jgi:hypothetical protein